MSHCKCSLKNTFVKKIAVLFKILLFTLQNGRPKGSVIDLTEDDDDVQGKTQLLFIAQS